MTVDQILKAASRQLADIARDRWAELDLLDYLNDALLRIVTLRPDAGQVQEVITLEQGSRQQLPAGALRLIEVTHNVGAHGSPGLAVRHVDARMLRAFLASWYRTAAQDEVHEYAWDAAKPREFYVYPPAIAGTEVSAAVVRAPRVSAPSDDFPLPDTYTEPTKAWVIASALMEDSGEGSSAKAQAYLNDFAQFLGIDAQAVVVASPVRGQPQ